MLQQHVFPIASGLPSPAERVLEREHRLTSGSVLITSFLYFVFLFTPGALAGLSVALGRSYGLPVYRFFVSWLFFWVTGLLTLDPFIVRYRTQLSDLINHWKRVLSCTRTCLNVSFEHGFLYFAMLWSLSYAFVFLEAIIALFWQLTSAIDITTFAFGACLVIYLVVWIGRIVRQHSHLIFSNQNNSTPIDPTKFVEIHSNSSHHSSSSSPREGKVPGDDLIVRLPHHPNLNLSPSVLVNGSARLDLTSHLQRNDQQMTISGNVVTVEPLDGSGSGYRCYRFMTWLLLSVVGTFVFILILRESFGWFAVDGWVQYATIGTIVVGVLILVFLFGRRYSDPTYLQFFMLLSTFFPTLYGSWLIQLYSLYLADQGTTSSSASANTTSAATVIMLFHLAISELYMLLMHSIVRHFSGPYLYVRFMMLPQTMAYVFELVIFGFTPWSAQYLLVLLFSSAHNVMSSTGMYGDFWIWLKGHICPQDPRITEMMRQRSAEKRMFEQLLAIRYNMQLFAQDTIADIWSFGVVLTLVGVVYAFGVPVEEVMPSFTIQPITLRLAVLVIARTLSWLCGQLIFRYKLDREAHRYEQDPTLSARGKSLSERLDEFLADLGLSVFQTAELRTCYEEDMPELFVAPPTQTGLPLRISDPQCVTDPCRLSVQELMVMQIAERQWLLHPSLLRKHFAYFHAIMYLLLFIVFQAASNSLPLRYAFFKPIQ